MVDQTLSMHIKVDSSLGRVWLKQASTKARIHRSVLVDHWVFSRHGHRLERLGTPRLEVEDVLGPHECLLVLRSVGRAGGHEGP